jgi:hypothetical protein
MNPMDLGQLDRLVDGELGEAERRELLLRLEHEPDGWRRCALAFLESQCWGEALHGLARGDVERTAAGGAAGTEAPYGSRRPSPWLHRLTTGLAMAATFLLALMIGWQYGPHSSQRIGPAVDDMANGAALQAPSPVASQDARPPQATQGPRTSANPWQMVTVSVPGAKPGQNQSIQLPAIELNPSDNSWLGSIPSLPQDVLEALERTGHQVRQSRQLLPMRLKDGRRVVVPMDQIEVHYVGGQGY